MCEGDGVVCERCGVMSEGWGSERLMSKGHKSEGVVCERCGGDRVMSEGWGSERVMVEGDGDGVMHGGGGVMYKKCGWDGVKYKKCGGDGVTCESVRVLDAGREGLCDALGDSYKPWRWMLRSGLREKVGWRVVHWWSEGRGRLKEDRDLGRHSPTLCARLLVERFVHLHWPRFHDCHPD